MALRFKCKNCGRNIVVESKTIGDFEVCRSCGVENVVPETAVEISMDESDKELVPEEEIDQMKCPECGAQMEGGASFCKECGAKLEEGVMYCSGCGKEIPNRTGFCAWCGAEVHARIKQGVDSRQRPTSVSVVSWIIIILNALALIIILLAGSILADSGMNMTIIVIGVIEGIVFILLGSGLLRGIDACRLAYLVLNPIALVATWATMGFQSIHVLTVLFYIIALVVLTRSEAVRFFKN